MTAAVSIARKLRSKQTDAELKLWLQLRGRRLGGLKFRRQVPIAGFIADFLCEEFKLIVEVDGGQHAEESTSDMERTKILQDAGYMVLRFWNNEVLTNLDGVLRHIAEAADLARSNIRVP
jgi:very-short-patch-repair endonuclease